MVGTATVRNLTPRCFRGSYRGTSLGGGRFLMSEVPLYRVGAAVGRERKRLLLLQRQVGPDLVGGLNPTP